MAKQESFIEIKGSVGKLSFYKTADGYLVRKKTSGGNPAKYARTREAMAHFGTAGKAGKVLRRALDPIAQYASDRKLVSRLSSKMSEVIKNDMVNPRGKKNVIDGETELLTGFEFNAGGLLGVTLKFQFESNIDRVSGKMNIKVPAFVPMSNVKWPIEASHCQLHVGGVEVDFEKGAYVAEFKTSEPFALDGTAVAALELGVALPPNSTHPLFLAFGITFWVKDVNGMLPVENKSYNALAIVEVSGV
jgi:hypothetical protein